MCELLSACLLGHACMHSAQLAVSHGGCTPTVAAAEVDSPPSLTVCRLAVTQLPILIKLLAPPAATPVQSHQHLAPSAETQILAATAAILVNAVTSCMKRLQEGEPSTCVGLKLACMSTQGCPAAQDLLHLSCRLSACADRHNAASPGCLLPEAGAQVHRWNSGLCCKGQRQQCTAQLG